MAKVNERLGDRKLSIILEPGRSIAANAGVLVTELLAIKEGEDRKFAIVDAAMNDLLRPALYDAEQQIIPAQKHDRESYTADVVGPICETGDFLGKDRQLNAEPNELLVIRSAGAYGFTMSSNYNSRPRAAEVMVDGEQAHLIRRRETIDDLVRGESLLP
jgi:diaminopimelate decarboxylase